MGVKYRLATLAGWVAMFSDPWEYVRFRRFMRANTPGTQEQFRVRALANALMTCRGGTSDAIVLRDTFAGRYHVPDGPPGPAVILDLGANAGYVAAHYATLYPDARIVSVEMDPGNAALCRRHTEPFRQRCTVVEAAIWTENGRVSYGGGNESAFSVTEFQAAVGNSGSARAVTIDTLLAECEVDRIGFIKMDIEGAEGPVLRAGGSWLDRTQAIQVEVHPPVTLDQVESLLRDAGFQVSRHRHHLSSVNGTRPRTQGATGVAATRPSPH
jgi:FkbM family methyltransferase